MGQGRLLSDAGRESREIGGGLSVHVSSNYDGSYEILVVGGRDATFMK